MRQVAHLPRAEHHTDRLRACRQHHELTRLQQGVLFRVSLQPTRIGCAHHHPAGYRQALQPLAQALPRIWTQLGVVRVVRVLQPAQHLLFELLLSGPLLRHLPLQTQRVGRSMVLQQPVAQTHGG